MISNGALQVEFAEFIPQAKLGPALLWPPAPEPRHWTEGV